MKELLALTWGERPGYRCILTIKDGRVKPHFVESTADAAELARKLDQHGQDVYFAPALFQDRRRLADQVRGIGSFYIDIDAGEDKPYPSWKYALLALLKWCKAQNFWAPSALVMSGNGLHVYWALDSGYAREDWLPVAQHLKQAMAVGGLQADAACTADAARILRLPGTHNYKDPERPRKVRQLFYRDRRLSLEEFRRKLPSVGPQGGVPSGPRPASEWDVQQELPPGDAPQIASACQQMGEVQEKRGAVPEPFWRAALSVLQRCTDSEHHIHEWSKGDPRYDRQQALEKARRTTGPATCQHFNDVNPAGCEGCPFASKVTSPVQLGVAAPEPKEDDKRIREVGQFRLTDAGVYFQPPAIAGQPPEQPWRVSRVPIWVEEVRERARNGLEADSSSLLIGWISIDRKQKKALLRQRDIYDTRAFKGWLADHNIISAITEAKFMVQYISQYSLAMMKTDGAREFHDNLGWYEGGFVLGDRLVTGDGIEEALVQGSNPISKLKRKGELDSWVQAANVFKAPEYWMHAFAVLCGFGSPLLHIAGTQSAVVSLVGPSGAGKTLAARAALSIYGDHQALEQGASATANAWEKQLGCNRHAPYLLDEVTQYSVKRLTEFVYMAANGQGKASLTRSRETREAANWQLVPFITSNHPVLEFHQRDIEEAHRRRLLEIAFPGAMDADDGALVDNAIRENHGVAAEPYLQQVIKSRKQIPTLFRKAMTQLRDRYHIPAANRFGLWTLASAMVGGYTAKALGLIDYDIDAIITRVARTLRSHAEATLLDGDRARDAILEWLAAHSKQICHWAEDRDVAMPVDDPVARFYSNGSIAVHRSRLNEMLQEEHLSRSSLRSWFDHVQFAPDRRKRLTPGTPAVWCYVFDTEKLGFSEEDLDAPTD